MTFEFLGETGKRQPLSSVRAMLLQVRDINRTDNGVLTLIQLGRLLYELPRLCCALQVFFATLAGVTRHSLRASG